MTARVVRETILIVGSGYAEEAFLKHLKCLFTSKAAGRSLTVGNARGGRAVDVIAETGRIGRRLPHKVLVALFDAALDSEGGATAAAQKKKVVAVSCTPCLEAVLLRLHGDLAERDCAGHQSAFVQRFGGPAHDPTVYAIHFPLQLLNATRSSCQQLDELLTLLGR